ncbi:hypothetical protein [Paenibacillus dendritiformis]|uniref:hypothetical protein n=1 Tax=Paenibacillus dendritiformis TaxID=130049 RepID=UPI0015EC487B|nr:hypothetical protein [Paenibacillus dendritiformis]
MEFVHDLRELLRALRLEPMIRWGYLLSPLGIPAVEAVYRGAALAAGIPSLFISLTPS